MASGSRAAGLVQVCYPITGDSTQISMEVGSASRGLILSKSVILCGEEAYSCHLLMEAHCEITRVVPWSVADSNVSPEI